MTKPRKHKTNFDAARAILGGPLTSLLTGALRRMEIAEEEMADAKRRWPKDAECLHRAVLLLCPNDALASANERLYRLHCRELLARVAAGEDTRSATHAELAAAVLSTLSVAAPLDRGATLLYWRTFTALFPKEAADLRAGVVVYANDETCVNDLERTLRKTLKVPTRTLKAVEAPSQPPSTVARRGAPGVPSRRASQRKRRNAGLASGRVRRMPTTRRA